MLVDGARIAYVLDGHPLGVQFAAFSPPNRDKSSCLSHRSPWQKWSLVARTPAQTRKPSSTVYAHLRIGFTSFPWGADAALLAARFRLRYTLKLPDAFQLASCILAGCDVLATHDRDFRRVSEVKILEMA